MNTRNTRQIFRIVLTTAVSAGALFICAPGFAQGYAGDGLSTSRANKTPAPLTLTAGEGDKRANEWKAYGRYQFTETWGAEFNYADWGRTGVTKPASAAAASTAAAAGPSGRGTQFNLSATGTMPIARSLSLIGKLGYGRHEIGDSPYCLSAACGPLLGGRSEGARAGVGLRYSFSDNWGLRLDYENVNSLANPNGLPAKGDSWSARIKYTF